MHTPLPPYLVVEIAFVLTSLFKCYTNGVESLTVPILILVVFIIVFSCVLVEEGAFILELIKFSIDIPLWYVVISIST